MIVGVTDILGVTDGVFDIEGVILGVVVIDGVIDIVGVSVGVVEIVEVVVIVGVIDGVILIVGVGVGEVSIVSAGANANTPALQLRVDVSVVLMVIVKLPVAVPLLNLCNDVMYVSVPNNEIDSDANVYPVIDEYGGVVPIGSCARPAITTIMDCD